MNKTIIISLLRASGLDPLTEQVLLTSLQFSAAVVSDFFQKARPGIKYDISNQNQILNHYSMKLILTLMLIICVSTAFAQTIDTITRVKSDQLAEKFPTKRNFEIRYEQFAPGNYAPEFNDVQQGTGRFTSHYRFKGAITVPIYTSKQWLINTSARYKYEVFEFGDFVSTGNVASPITREDKEEYHLFTGALSVTRFGYLFGKRMVYNGILLADASDQDFGRVKGNLSATMILKRTKNTSIALGVAGVFDPSAPIPILPVFSYQHDFKNDWSLDLFMPQRILVRKGVFKNGRISLGTEMESELLYIRENDQKNSTIYDYRQMELKSGLTYEHNLGHSIIATFKGGFTNYINARGVIKGKTSDDFEFKTHPDATGYFSVGISFHPFEK
jgi:hypothetical protein